MQADSLNGEPRDMAMACNLQLGYHDDNGDGGRGTVGRKTAK